MAKLEVEPDRLPELHKLLKFAEVSEDDIKAAAERWKADPPNSEYKKILDAELIKE